MKKYFGLLMLTATLFVAGCGNKKQNKAAIQQKEIVESNFVQEEQTADKKEDYSIIA
ncbi:MAG: hypothetical protein JO129_01210 [Candidatus Dependentiae bacterium]|nr:hypothetical protein [Candidatus Dependentiae bacterium]